MMQRVIAPGSIHEDALTVNGQDPGENCRRRAIADGTSSGRYDLPLRRKPASKCSRGNLFDSAIMKASVIAEDFRARYLPPRPIRTPSKAAPWCSMGPRTITAASMTRRSPSMTAPSSSCAAAAPIGYPGPGQVVNMQPPRRCSRQGITSAPCIGDGRQSGTSARPRSSMPRRRPRGRRPGAAADRRPDPHRSQPRHRQYADLRGRARTRRRRWRNRAASHTPKAKPRGRRSSAARRISWPTAWSSSPPSNISASPRSTFRATAIERGTLIQGWVELLRNPSSQPVGSVQLIRVYARLRGRCETINAARWVSQELNPSYKLNLHPGICTDRLRALLGRLLGPGQIEGAVDQRHMGEGLRKIADRRPLRGSYSSLRRPTSLHSATSRSNNARASSQRPCST